MRDPGELLQLLGLDPAWLPGAQAAARLFPLRVPHPYLRRIRHGDPRDPLLRQVLPLDDETVPTPGYQADPLQEAAAAIAPGLLQKYQGRALLIATGACAVHCRYCFRRHFPYGEHHSGRHWEAALAQVRADDSLREVILSGGDPLSLGDEPLAELAAALAAIPHLRRLRIHTRLPIVVPERVNDALGGWLAHSPLRTVVVVHVNHPNEIDAAVRDSLRRMTDFGVTLLNQSVLLRGVNDDATTLISLSEALFDAGTLPYYLHALDPVAGAAHFAVPDPVAQGIHREITARLPGYLVPRLVRELPGAPAKLPIPL